MTRCPRSAVSIVVGERLRGADSVRKQRRRGVSKSGENFNDDAVPPVPGTGLTASQAAAIENLLRGNPLDPHDLASEPIPQADGSVTCEVFNAKRGRHTVNVTPRGKLTRPGLGE